MNPADLAEGCRAGLDALIGFSTIMATLAIGWVVDVLAWEWLHARPR